MFRTKAQGVKSGAKKGGLISAAVMTIALPFTAQHEGLRLKAYLDPVGIPTICYGETKGVEIGDVKTREECDNMLAMRLAWFGYKVDQLVMPEMRPETHAALSSFAYNVGIGAFERSTLLRKMNTGDELGACDELTRWVFAKGKKLPGLVKRRKHERELCRKGVSDKMNRTGRNI